MRYRMVFQKTIAAVACLLAVAAIGLSPALADWGDDFNDGVIDTTKWLADVQDPLQSQNVEAEGYLKLDRYAGDGYTDAKAVALGQVAASLDGRLVVEFDLSLAGEGNSNYAYVQITPVKHTDPDEWYDANGQIDSVTFMSCGWHPTYTDGWYNGRQYVDDTDYDSLTTFEQPIGVHRIILEENEIDPSGIHVYFEKWEGTVFVPKHDFALKEELVSAAGEYYVTLGRNSWKIAAVLYDYVDVSGGGTPEPIPGDANLDNVVNDADASILAAHWQQTEMGWGDGDFNGDNVVNDADASILAAHWQESQEGAAAVPEPGAAVLLLGGLLSLLVWRRRR